MSYLTFIIYLQLQTNYFLFKKGNSIMNNKQQLKALLTDAEHALHYALSVFALVEKHFTEEVKEETEAATKAEPVSTPIEKASRKAPVDPDDYMYDYIIDAASSCGKCPGGNCAECPNREYSPYMEKS